MYISHKWFLAISSLFLDAGNAENADAQYEQQIDDNDDHRPLEYSWFHFQLRDIILRIFFSHMPC